MLKAVIDIGTNSTRLAIAQCEQDQATIISNDIAITRIGEQLGDEKIIKPLPLSRTVAVVQQFVNRARELGAQQIIITATSAVRDAHNQQAVAQAIWEATAVSLTILTGEQEAALSYRGACSGISPGVAVAVLDIGGGSTELVYPLAERLHCASVNVGAVRLLEHQSLIIQTPQLLQGLINEAYTQGVTLIAVGGTATSLAAMDQQLVPYRKDKVQGYCLSKQAVSQWVERLATMPLAEKKQLQGLMPKRADIIYYGAYILEQVMVLLGVNEVMVSDNDLLYGLLISES